MGGKDAEKTTRTFVNAIRQITPSYQRRILLFLAKNHPKRFTNIQIAHALDEDRSNVWRFLNLLIEEGADNSMIEKTLQGGTVLYCWKEPEITIDGFKLSQILKVLEALEKEKEMEGNDGK
jgi:predicted transcriptional regulator with HTH domain